MLASKYSEKAAAFSWMLSQALPTMSRKTSEFW